MVASKPRLLGLDSAPVIFFEHVISFNQLGDVVGFTLGCGVSTPEERAPRTDLAVTAQLKCTVQSAKMLREMLDKAILAATVVGRS
jgi:hypothetical protein